jgi:hypothetical protein
MLNEETYKHCMLLDVHFVYLFLTDIHTYIHTYTHTHTHTHTHMQFINPSNSLNGKWM